MTLTQRSGSKKERTADELARIVGCSGYPESATRGQLTGVLHESRERIDAAILRAKECGYGYDPRIIVPLEIASHS